jgi:3-isopropylmalate dehydrogenase
VPRLATPTEHDWLACVVGAEGPERTRTPLIGALAGDGVGPEVIAAALHVAERLEEAGGSAVEVEFGGPIGRTAERAAGHVLPDEVVDFCAGVFARGGAVLNGPGAGRYVYDLRRRLELFLKITPIQTRIGLPEASPLRPEANEGIDLLVVRENLGGIYQGRGREQRDAEGGRLAQHAFSYAEADVRRFLAAAARLAAARRGDLTVVVKEAGIPGVSALWRDCAMDAAEAIGVTCTVVDVDLMAYRLVASPRDFDVVAAPNLCGDVLSDLAAVLVGSRPLSFSGNYTPGGDAVYQTNHGAAEDIAGADRANPIGQILSLAMLLRVSLALEREADAIEEGVRQVWRDGHRTADLAGDGDVAVGTRAMGELVGEAAAAHFAGAPAA